ncbi:ABC transporter permease [Streptomyces spiroverticillatus]|uniref:ABC transporter permease n=1 Tax=Streptomyces finlayi TaxID=67296 RepID=A0A918WWI5_9ACTN|nr:FtsX-like permease family protein [Streptomyces finlayi]GHA07187.1 ABC transporter permease [Streptomyces spiroverticillatus]GHC90611.1 ABC transporter permease [Streptomyces finlayi]
MSNGLARAAVRFRPASFVGSFVALLLGAAVLAGCGALLQTGILAKADPVRYAHAPVVVAADPYTSLTVNRGSENEQTIYAPLPERGRVDTALAVRIAARPGVASAVPDASFPVQQQAAKQQSRSLTGGNIAAAGSLVAGRAPAAREVVLDRQAAGQAGVKTGDRIRLTAPGGTGTYTVSGLAAPSPLGTQAWFAAPTADRLSGHPGKADAILVTPKPGTAADALAAQVEQAVGDKAQVLTGADRGGAEFPALAAGKTYLLGLGGSFGGIAAMTAVFVVMGTLALATNQRAREFALLRAIGATPKQIRRTIATEAMLLAPAAGLLGAIPGYALARWWFDELVERGAVPPQISLETGVLPVVAAVLISVLSALGAGRLAARKPSKLRPGLALGEAAVPSATLGKVRVGFGIGFCAGGAAMAAVASQLGGDAAAVTALGVVMCFLVGVALLGPIIAQLGTGFLSFPLKSGALGASGSLSADNTRANARRLASAITPIVMVIAFCGTLVFMQSSIREASARNVSEAVVADRVLTAGSGAGLPAETAGYAAALPGVESATGILRTGVVYESMQNLATAPALGVSGNPAALPKVLDLGLTSGSFGALAKNTVALDARFAENLGVRTGDRVPLRLGDGTKVTPKVVATYDRGLGVGLVLFPRADVVAHVTAPYDTQVLVAAKAGAEQGALAKDLQRFVPSAAVSDAAGYGVQADLAQELGAWANTVMAAVLGGFAAVAAVNTLVMTVLERRREVGLLRLSGTTRRQVRGMMRWEALLVAGTGLILGSAIAGITLLPIARGVTGSGPHIPMAVAVPLAVGTVLLTVVATAFPTRALLRVRPLEAGAGRQ